MKYEIKMKKSNKKQMKEYEKNLDKEAKKFKITSKDLFNLYDLFYIVNWQDYRDLKLNKIDKWFNNFFHRIEKIVVPELYQNEKK